MVSPYSDIESVMMGMNIGGFKIYNNLLPSAPADITGNHIEHTMATLTNGVGSYFWYRDGTLQSTNTTVNSVGNTTVRLGIAANASASSLMDGTYQVYEIILYNSALGNFQRQQIEGYLAWKWGLTSVLPNAHSLRALPPFSRTSWTPLDAGDCVLWLDATDMSGSPANASTVSNWFDKSGLSNHYTGTSSTITYQTNILNSLPAIRFTAGGRLAEDAPVDFPVGNSSAFESTTFVVASASNTTTGGMMVFGPVAGGAAKVYYTEGGFVYSTMFAGVAGISNAITTGTAFMFSDTYRFTGTTSNTVHTGWFNGSNSMSATGSNVNLATTPNYIGHTGFGSEFFSGNIHEILRYRGVLPEANRILVEAYLTQKWGLTSNLPTGHIGRLYRPLAPYFSPLAIQDCATWFDAADSNSLTLSGSNLTQWNDKSGSSNHASNFTGTTTFSTTALSNRPAVIFNGTSALRSSLSFGSMISVTAFIVARTNSANGWSGAMSINSYGGSGSVLGRGNMLTFYQSGANNNWWFSGSTPETDGNTTTVTLSTSRTDIVVGSWRPLASQVNVNGTMYSSSTSAPSSLGAGTSMIGCTTSNATALTEFWNGFVQEVIVYRGNLSTIQKQKIEGYLAWKWGLQASLPATHPHSKNAPI